MLKHIGFFTFLWLLLSTSVFGQPALTAQPYEKDYQQIQKGDLKLWGCFDKPCSVDPDQINLFGYSTKYSIVSYHFLGRTGEKTFDILKSETDTSTRSFQTKREIYHLYFVANDLVYVFHTSPFRDLGCSNSDNIYLKMLDLKGNRLRFQIMLPECLRKTP